MVVFEEISYQKSSMVFVVHDESILKYDDDDGYWMVASSKRSWRPDGLPKALSGPKQMEIRLSTRTINKK